MVHTVLFLIRVLSSKGEQSSYDIFEHFFHVYKLTAYWTSHFSNVLSPGSTSCRNHVENWKFNRWYHSFRGYSSLSKCASSTFASFILVFLNHFIEFAKMLLNIEIGHNLNRQVKRMLYTHEIFFATSYDWNVVSTKCKRKRVGKISIYLNDVIEGFRENFVDLFIHISIWIDRTASMDREYHFCKIPEKHRSYETTMTTKSNNVKFRKS